MPSFQICLCCVFLFLADKLAAQSDYAHVDSLVASLHIRSRDVDEVAHRLTQPFDREADKVRAIFYWMATHIAYDCKRYRSAKRRRTIKGRNATHVQRKKNRLHRKALRRTLGKRKGICQDYADLFTALCKAAHLRAETITGHAKRYPFPVSRTRFGSNHAWNLVYIDEQPHLLDVTWASGYTDKRVTHFRFALNEAYYLTDPAKLIYDHYPRYESHQLLADPVSERAYIGLPAVGSYFLMSELAGISGAYSPDRSQLCVEVLLGELAGQPRFMAKDTNGNSLPLRVEAIARGVRLYLPTTELRRGKVSLYLQPADALQLGLLAEFMHSRNN